MSNAYTWLTAAGIVIWASWPWPHLRNSKWWMDAAVYVLDNVDAWFAGQGEVRA